MGELALLVFHQGQNPLPFQSIDIAAEILHFATVQPHLLKLALEYIFEAWQRGRAARLLLPIRWEEMWDQPLEEIRSGLTQSRECHTERNGV